MKFLAIVSDEKYGNHSDDMAFYTLEAAKDWVLGHDSSIKIENGSIAAHYYEIHEGDYIYDVEGGHFTGGGLVVEEGEL